MKRLLVGVFTALVLLCLIGLNTSAEEPALKLVRVQPFTVDFQISKYNPPGAIKTKYYIYRQEGFEIETSTANLLSQLTLPSAVTFDWSNTDVDQVFQIEKGFTYTYIVKAEALNESNNIISSFTTNSVIISIPKPNVSFRLLDKDGEVLSNLPIEIIGNGYDEAAFSNGRGYISGFTLDDGQYDIVVRSRETQQIIKKGILVISNGGSINEQVVLETVETNNSNMNKPGSSGGGSNSNKESKPSLDDKYMINLIVGKNEAIVNDEPVQLDSPIYIKNNRTMVPIRFMAERLGSEVSWDDITSTVTFELNGRIVILKIKEPFALIDEQIVALDVPAEIHNGRTMIPIRFVAETFGFNFGWDSQTRTVSLSNP